MLSDEEKKAIEVIKGLAVYYDDYSLLDEEEIEENEEVNNSINIVINLIEKQSKEIERINEILIWKQKHEEQLQKEIEELKDMNERQQYRLKLTDKETIENYYISKDKIKAKIEELDKVLEREFLVNSLRDMAEDQKKNFAITFRKGVNK